MTKAAPERIWTWPSPYIGGHYRKSPRRPLDPEDGPTGEEYVRADIAADLRAQIERLTAINAERAATIARMMRKGGTA